MISKDMHYVIVGASNNQEKYGFKVFKDLLDAGYKVTPINPNEKEILGQDVYPTITDFVKILSLEFGTLPIKSSGALHHPSFAKEDNRITELHKISNLFVVFVVPPKVTESVLEEVAVLGIKHVWMQPGAESDNAIEFCKQHQIDCIANACVMIQRNAA